MTALVDRPTPDAIEKVYSLSFSDFENRWKSFLKSKGLKGIEGSRVRHFKVKKDGKEDEDVVELREIQSAVARNRTHLADELLAKGRTAAAANEYQRALQASPQSPVILNKLARAYIQLNRFDDALPLLNKVLAVDPDSANTYVQLGRIHHAAKEFPEARAVLEEAIQINPYNPLIYRLLIETYAATGEAEKGKQARVALDKLTGAS
jgi:tetratricopeptide (TPR) repeat protein